MQDAKLSNTVEPQVQPEELSSKKPYEKPLVIGSIALEAMASDCSAVGKNACQIAFS